MARARPLHLPDQDLHAVRPRGVRRRVHQGIGQRFGRRDYSADATQVPTTPVAATAVPMSVVPTTPDYAGRTYEDYLAANPQLAQPQASAPQPAAPQKN